jgi:hypothetical protein
MNGANVKQYFLFANIFLNSLQFFFNAEAQRFFFVAAEKSRNKTLTGFEIPVRVSLREKFLSGFVVYFSGFVSGNSRFVV